MYASLFQSVLFPLYETHLRKRDTLRALAALEQSQWRTPEEVAEDSFRKLLEALHHAETNVPFYRRRFAEYGVRASQVKAPADLAAFPILTKEDVRLYSKELVAESHVGRLHQGATGGSTGVPVRFAYDHPTYERRVAAALRADGWAGAALGEKELHVWGRPPGEKKGFATAKRAVHEAFWRRKYVSTFHLRADRLADTVREIVDYAPRVVVGYTTPLFLLARAALEHGITIPPPRGVITSAEKLFEPQREVIERAFGAPVFDRYGCREVMLIGAECERHEGLHVHAEGVFVELFSGGRPVPVGTPGEVLLTDLYNRAMPFLRYRNEDVAVAKAGACACGRGLPRLASVEGRVLDLLIGEDSRIVAGEMIPFLFKDLPVERYQVHQRADRTVTLRIVPGPSYGPEVTKLVDERLRLVLGANAPLTVELVRDIPLTAAGKHRVTVSDVPVDLGSVTIKKANEDKPAARVATPRPRTRVAHVVLGLRAGGLERVVLDLVQGMDRSRFDPMVVALDEPGELAPRLASMDVPLRLLKRGQGLDPSVIGELSELFGREGIDLVHTHNPRPHVHGALAALAARRVTGKRPRVVHTKHGRNYPDDLGRVIANRMASALSDRIVAVSDDARRVALEIERGSARRLVTIRNGVDTRAYKPGDAPRARQALDVPAGVLHVGCVARLSAEKDHATLITAFARVRTSHPGAQLTLVGDGAERASLEALVKKFGLQGAVSFLGHRDDVAALLPGFDLFALASRTEGTSLTLLEAAAAGLPIVATRVGGNPEVVADGETGLLVPAGQPAALADAIGSVWARPDRARMGAAGRALVEERYGMGKMLSAYETLYAEVLRLA
ncbi:glycosyltransferase [Polyangium mundeleinium]|uniref:Glycosyltransferase n=1 Tax=Polyangium mundeleinium TaxID=2995306 RepID=A0ABT5F7K1_9BACT|nr:glycosyltransferase [Polyangium mundeleinium]MDC0749467.1 glycosyltransferase [Polyangium mundeleinium]